MATYRTGPGAWLGGRVGAANTPIERPRGSNTPIGPPHAGHTPIGPPHAGHTPIGPPRGSNTPIEPPHGSHTPIGPGAVPSPAPYPLPWEGVHPDWTFGDGEALLGQALAKSRVAVVQRDPDLLRPTDQRRAAALGRAVDGSHLWRWAPEFRVNAVQGDLQGRFQVAGGRLWMLGRAAADRPVPATCVFKIERRRGALALQEQIDKVQRAAAEREDRLPEILAQADGFWPFFESITGISLEQRPRLAELLEVADGVARHLLMSLKNNLGSLRPMQCSTLVAPVIPTPGHGSLPSGHATMSALIAELLGALVYRDGGELAARRVGQMDRLARRIAFNRVVAGVHFPFDNLVGYALGTQLGRLFAALAGGARPWPGCVDDAEIDLVAAGLELPPSGDRPRTPPGGIRPEAEPSWAELWRRALAEARAARV